MALCGQPDTRVLIRRCETYDRDILRRLVRQGMRDLGFTPRGKVFVKPNVAFAGNGRYGCTAWTHTSVVGGSIQAICDFPEVGRADLGENMGIGFPTRMAYSYAGYYKEAKEVRRTARCPVSIFCIDEARRKEVFIGGRVHSTLRVARKMAEADCKVYLPKLKCHCASVMTGAVKLNMGICSDDERAIRHDFLLNDKIVDLLAAGYPDFVVMDAVDVGVGSEVVPTPRRLGLILMGRNPLAVDIVGARLLGHSVGEVPHLKRAVERGYGPASPDDVTLLGDITTLEELDCHARRILPYDEEFRRWRDIGHELELLGVPWRFVWGPSRTTDDEKCDSGCVMGLKIFLATLERYAGAELMKKARPAFFIIGNPREEVDCGGHDAFIIGSCSNPVLVNAGKVVRIDRCFTTASDLLRILGFRLGRQVPVYDLRLLGSFVYFTFCAAMKKLVTLRYLQDFKYFMTKGFQQKI